MLGSTFMAWLVVVGLVAVSTPRGSTRPPSWLRPVSRWRRRRVSWRAGWVPDEALFVAYSMAKEDIYVARIPTP